MSPAQLYDGFHDTLRDREIIPWHSRPSPWYPGLQAQLYAPLVLLHTASTLQLCVPVTHSSISEKEGSFYLEVSFIICFDGAVLNKPCKYPRYSVHWRGNNCNMFRLNYMMVWNLLMTLNRQGNFTLTFASVSLISRITINNYWMQLARSSQQPLISLDLPTTQVYCFQDYVPLFCCLSVVVLLFSQQIREDVLRAAWRPGDEAEYDMKNYADRGGCFWGG